MYAYDYCLARFMVGCSRRAIVVWMGIEWCLVEWWAMVGMSWCSARSSCWGVQSLWLRIMTVILRGFL